MVIMIYLIIIILYAVLLFWTWNNVKQFENIAQKIGYIGIGLIILFAITWILFSIAKSGVDYPSVEIMKEVRKMALLIFVPINGFLSLPHFASIVQEITTGTSDEKTRRRATILGIVIVIAIIIEIAYMKSFQNGIIEILNSK